MDIQTERTDGALIAKAEGRIDGVNARDFEEALTTAISGDDKAVVMDLEGLSYISSAGLRVILLIAKTLRKREADFMLCSLSDPIREVFEISGFDKIIPVHASREGRARHDRRLDGPESRQAVLDRRAACTRLHVQARKKAGAKPPARQCPRRPHARSPRPLQIRAGPSPRHAPLRARRGSHPSSRG